MAEKERVWYDLRPHKFRLDDTVSADDEEDILLGGLEDKVKVLRKLSPEEYIVVGRINYTDGKNSNYLDTRDFQIQIDGLRMAGLDIGKGDAEYGYRMPIPGKGAEKRQLIVFRR